MKLKRMWRMVLPACIVLWTLFIFSQSLLSARASTVVSEAVKKEFAWMWNDAAPPIRVNDEIVTFSHVIRKLAHLAEFGLLGLLWGGCGRSYDRRLLWLWGLPTGVVDECLQFFAPGRAPLVADVVLDTAGYLCGTAVILLVTHLWRKKKN
ncbi:MAG: VanZ family protein [Clostridia bacterium]|nr:VanZ family protein [Clostridia bacterium]